MDSSYTKRGAPVAGPLLGTRPDVGAGSHQVIAPLVGLLAGAAVVEVVAVQLDRELGDVLDVMVIIGAPRFAASWNCFASRRVNG